MGSELKSRLGISSRVLNGLSSERYCIQVLAVNKTMAAPECVRSVFQSAIWL
jgi:ACT domain-containing protein